MSQVLGIKADTWIGGQWNEKQEGRLCYKCEGGDLNLGSPESG